MKLLQVPATSQHSEFVQVEDAQMIVEEAGFGMPDEQVKVEQTGLALQQSACVQREAGHTTPIFAGLTDVSG